MSKKIKVAHLIDKSDVGQSNVVAACGKVIKGKAKSHSERPSCPLCVSYLLGMSAQRGDDIHNMMSVMFTLLEGKTPAPRAHWSTNSSHVYTWPN